MRRWLVAAFCVVLAGVLTSVEPTDARNLDSQAAARRGGPRVKTVRVRGTSLAYVERGRGQPVVLIHGWLHDYRTWDAQLPELSKRFRVIAYSRRYNYPNTPGDGSDYSVATNVADLAALIQALKLGRVHLVGHSAGGTIALLVVRDHPELVRSLVLAEGGGPGLLAENPEAQALRARARSRRDEAHQAFQKGDWEGAARILVDGIVGQEGAYEEMSPARRQAVLDNLQVEMKAELSAPPRQDLSFTCDDVRRITAPTLLVEGERTLRLFQLMTQELQKCLPNSERAVLPQATHALQMENPAGFNEIVLRFLTRHSGRTRR